MNSLLKLMHDTASPLGKLKNSVWLYNDKKEKGDLTQEDIDRYFKWVLEAKESLQNQLDKFYIEHKEMFEYKLPLTT